ncbi:MAG: DUF177 domain-containing protein [Rhodobacteraceae bacterium]|nr:DUF177 domain-containing protein [Paracoccaceae bacterium]
MPEPRIFRTSDLARRVAHAFALEPDAAERAALARVLGASEIRKLRFAGELRPEGRRDWRLEATLGATVVQPCVVTLEPVVTRIDEAVVRRYLADWPEPEPGSETEMPEDDSAEPLGGAIDPAVVMAEALALALPDFPRAAGVEIGTATAAPPGAAPFEAQGNPFAALAQLKKDAP